MSSVQSNKIRIPSYRERNVNCYLIMSKIKLDKTRSLHKWKRCLLFVHFSYFSQQVSCYIQYDCWREKEETFAFCHSIFQVACFLKGLVKNLMTISVPVLLFFISLFSALSSTFNLLVIYFFLSFFPLTFPSLIIKCMHNKTANVNFTKFYNFITRYSS